MKGFLSFFICFAIRIQLRDDMFTSYRRRFYVWTSGLCSFERSFDSKWGSFIRVVSVTSFRV